MPAVAALPFVGADDYPDDVMDLSEASLEKLLGEQINWSTEGLLAPRQKVAEIDTSWLPGAVDCVGFDSNGEPLYVATPLDLANVRLRLIDNPT